MWLSRIINLKKNQGRQTAWILEWTDGIRSGSYVSSPLIEINMQTKPRPEKTVWYKRALSKRLAATLQRLKKSNYDEFWGTIWVFWIKQVAILGIPWRPVVWCAPVPLENAVRTRPGVISNLARFSCCFYVGKPQVLFTNEMNDNFRTLCACTCTVTEHLFSQNILQDNFPLWKSWIRVRFSYQWIQQMRDGDIWDEIRTQQLIWDWWLHFGYSIYPIVTSSQVDLNKFAWFTARRIRGTVLLFLWSFRQVFWRLSRAS